ncbi:MAG: thermonuclease family protein [Candidatus Omnitrophota bacterium]
MLKPEKLHPVVYFVLFITLFLTFVVRFSSPTKKVPDEVVVAAAANIYDNIAVVYVYDGDTVKLANGEKVRLLGIDTPESSENKKLIRDVQRSGKSVQEILQMGHLSAGYTRSFLAGRRVRLEFDIERRDKYGRLLAYVYRVSDGLFINAEIIKNGFAYPMTIPPNVRYADIFKKLFRQAREGRRGLWSRFTPDSSGKISGTGDEVR